MAPSATSSLPAETAQPAPPRPHATRSGRAMGTRFDLVITADDPSAATRILDATEDRLHTLEARWSRFVAGSEISAINAAPEQWHLVSADTAVLVDRARQAWMLTGGAFDPTVLEIMCTNGYRRSQPHRPGAGPVPAGPTEPPPGCAEIEVDVATGLVRIGSATGFDPGGIGKGLAGDLLVGEARRLGAAGAMVSIGGDIVCEGTPPDGAVAWAIDVRGAGDSTDHLTLTRGAVVTSTIEQRKWSTDRGPRHHLVDPRSGDNTRAARSATVVAGEGWYAEAIAKQLMVEGPDALIDHERATAIVIDGKGMAHDLGVIERYRR